MKLKTPKTCSCGRVHHDVPSVPLFEAEELTGYYWDCECKSTLFAPLAIIVDGHQIAAKLTLLPWGVTPLFLCLLLPGCGGALPGSVDASSGGGTSGSTQGATSPSGSTQAVSGGHALDAVSACPSGMTMMPAAVGHGAFCVDATRSGPGTVSQATMACAAQGKTMCTAAETGVACTAGIVPQGAWTWTGTPTPLSATSPGQILLLGASGCSDFGPIDTAGTRSFPYFCCSR